MAARGRKRFLPDAKRFVAFQIPEYILDAVKRKVKTTKGQKRGYSRSELFREAVAQAVGLEWKPLVAAAPRKLGRREERFLRTYNLVREAFPRDTFENHLSKTAETQGLTYSSAKTYFYGIRGKGHNI